jgi:hypothetical protein
MNKEIAKKWVDALRSGDYVAARKQLRAGDRFCCLGVLCDVYAQENAASWDGEKFFGEIFYAPETVTDWVGLGVEMQRERGTQGFYAEMQDGGKSFAEIAAQIEKDAGLTDSDSPSVSGTRE